MQALPFVAMAFTGAAAVGSYAMARYQSQMEMAIARQQAEELKLAAKQERAVAHMEAARKRSENKFKIGEAKAGLAGSGFVLDDAQSAFIIGESVAEATLSEKLIIAQGDQRARNMEAGAKNTLWEGKMKKKLNNFGATVGLVKDLAGAASMMPTGGGGGGSIGGSGGRTGPSGR
jgi:hypothetical protein